MTIKQMSKIQIGTKDLNFTFLNSGDLQEITHQNQMINQVVSNPIDGSLNNLYLRIHRKDHIQAFPLLGIQSNSRFSYSESQVVWEGTAAELDYKVIFTLSDQGVWFWNVTLDGHCEEEIDIIYGQDLGLADRGAVRNNEAYTAQYIDHSVYHDEAKGYVLCSRQNQRQEGGFPYIQQGSLTKATGYSTDGFQFFGLSYKETNEPEILSKEHLANEVYQYEFAYTALQSDRVRVNGETQFVFYGLFKENHAQKVDALEFENEIQEAWQHVQSIEEVSGYPVDKVDLSAAIGEPLQTASMTQAEIDDYFPDRHQEEWDGQSLLSFFTKTHEHIVLKEKELLIERPHGHILMSGQNVPLKEDVLTTTSYMYGIFNSTLSVGNTSFNKMLSNIRNPLNALKTSGQRIYVSVDSVYHQLTMPSMFEMGFNYVRWFYKTDTDIIEITNFTRVDSPEVQLHVRSRKGKTYRFIVTNQVTMDANEYESLYDVNQEDAQTLSYYAGPSALNRKIYNDLRFRMRITGAEWQLTDETILASQIEPGSASLSVLDLEPSSEWSLTIQGLLDGESRPYVEREAAIEIENYRKFFRKIMNGFQLSHIERHLNELERVNDLAWWYTHNMLVHYSVPHGLEQYNGAAWGTRDVCQGPSEYFLATQNYETVADILKTVYSHQYEDKGNWPQWFMFDQYHPFQMDESHGDIVVWPIKVLSDYLASTGDYELLQQKVPYTNRENFEFTFEKATLLEHVKKEIQYIQDHFLHDTHLSAYDDGDWDDTLQPANEQLKKYMVSSWTVALTYQAVNQLAKVLVDVDKSEAYVLKSLAEAIQSDFNQYIMSTDTIPGFLYMEEPEAVEFMLHPDDRTTGIHYRLLPMNRGVISELFSGKQAESHYRLIKEQLACPDGVRLMNRPAHYNGGISKHFKRAETAANFGREIGLQYVHAHIRFVEAMAKMGKSDEVWHGLEVINPVGIQEVVHNAERRQSNAYFSSSDGKFRTRYDAQEHFGELREGTIPVKGGWRIYSSGPGIYMNQLISNALGIRVEAGDLVIDPVLPSHLDGLQFDYWFLEYPVTFVYQITGEAVERILINGQEVESHYIANRYRPRTGVRISKTELEKYFESNANQIEIIM